MRYTLLIILLFEFLLFTPGTTQDINFKEWDKAKLKKANTAFNTVYLSTDEKKVVYYVNLARINGKLFADTWLRAYVDSGYANKRNKYVKSLFKDLYKLTELPCLYPEKDLYKAALYHARDMGKTGKVSHNSSNGKSFPERLKWYIPKTYTIGENCDYGNNSPLEIVMRLLIDKGVASLGHRKNILDADFEKIGVSIQPHKVYGQNCVMDFMGTGYTLKKSNKFFMWIKGIF